MIEITQWRASIGIWNHSQAALASSGLHFHLLKTTGHSNSITTVEMGLASLIHISLFLCFLLLLQTSGTQWTIKLCVTLYSIAGVSVSGYWYQVHSPNDNTFTAMNMVTSIIFLSGDSNFDVFFLILFYLLLSGDVELNPGPKIDDKPDLFLMLKWLEPLNNLKSFCLLLPGMTQKDICTMELLNVRTEYQKVTLFSKWINKNPSATWSDVLNALTKSEEHKLVEQVREKLNGQKCTKGMHNELFNLILEINYFLGGSVSTATPSVASNCCIKPAHDHPISKQKVGNNFLE